MVPSSARYKRLLLWRRKQLVPPKYRLVSIYQTSRNLVREGGGSHGLCCENVKHNSDGKPVPSAVPEGKLVIKSVRRAICSCRLSNIVLLDAINIYVVTIAFSDTSGRILRILLLKYRLKFLTWLLDSAWEVWQERLYSGCSCIVEENMTLLTSPHALNLFLYLINYWSCCEDVWGSGSIAPPSLSSVLHHVEWSASLPGRFTPRQTASCSIWIEGWVGPSAGQDAVENCPDW
jgi:hypothetical protein